MQLRRRPARNGLPVDGAFDTRSDSRAHFRQPSGNTANIYVPASYCHDDCSVNNNITFSERYVTVTRWSFDNDQRQVNGVSTNQRSST